jgi:HlyD family secretion protein
VLFRSLRATQAELQRSRELIAQGFLSPSRLDEAQRAEAVARAQLDAARAQAGALDEAGSDVAQAQAQLTQAQAAALTAQAKLAQTQLRAPADAMVLDRLAEPGQIVQPGKALLVLALRSPLELVAQVDERYLEQLAPGQSATVLADAYPERRFAAKLLRIAPLVDAQRGAVEVRLAPQPPLPDFLREDMTLSVEVETARRERVLWLPIEALRVPNGTTAASPAATAATGERATVWRMAEGRVEGRVEEREIRVGLRTLAAVEVTEGLAAGDVVLVGAAPPPGSRARAAIRPADASQALRKSGTAGDAGSALTSAMGR